MHESVAKHSILLTGSARFDDLIYVTARDRELDEQEKDHARFLAFYRGDLAHLGDRPWNSVASGVVKVPSEKMVAVGEDGEVFTFVGGVSKDEAIEPSPAALRGFGIISGVGYACGAKREVYKRQAENSWVAMHAPAPGPSEYVGFEAICGFNESEMYAVGWDGEIWEWNGEKWHSHTSPSNLILTSACCGGDGLVYIGGQHGTLLRGRHDEWEVLEVTGNEDFWDVLWFQDKLYIASMSVLYELAAGEFIPVVFQDDIPSSFGKLTAASGVMWSIGSSDLFSFDGGNWSRMV